MDYETLALAKKKSKKQIEEAMEGAGVIAGKSAYQIAVDNGFVGTEKQWLASLKGEPGTNGTDGVDGTSATITVGNVTSGAAPSVSNRGTPQAAILDFVLQKGDKGDAGRDGRDGQDGRNGADGADGKSFTIKAQYASYADLIADYPTGQIGDAFFVGTSNNPDLYVWLADSSEWFNSGPISGVKGDKGDAGRDGQDGQDGDDGYSPTATVTSDSTGVEIRITDKNGTTTAHVNNGTDGQDGSDGAAGSDGGDGYSPTVTVKTNTSDTYILTVTYKDANGDVQTFDTPNLKGVGGSGGGNGVVFAYVVDESEEFSEGWLSETDGGEALTPNEELLYIVLSEGDYQNLIYRFDGTNYVDVNGGGYWEGNIFEYKQLPRIDVDKFYYVNGYDATASSSSEYEPYTIDHVLLSVANGTYTLRIKSTLTKAYANGLRLTIEDDVVNKIITEVTSMRISTWRTGSPRLNSATSMTDSGVFISIDPKYGSAYKASVDLDITGTTTYTGSFEHLYLGKVLFRPLEEIGTNSEGGGAVFAYVVSGSTEFSDGWLSETDGGTALTPDEKLLYVVISAGEYKDKIYRFDGTEYIEISKAPKNGNGSSKYEVIAVGTGATNKAQLNSFFPYLEGMDVEEFRKTAIIYLGGQYGNNLYHPCAFIDGSLYEYGVQYCFGYPNAGVEIVGVRSTDSYLKDIVIDSSNKSQYSDNSNGNPGNTYFELVKIKDALPATTKKITVATYPNQSFKDVGNAIATICTTLTDDELETYQIIDPDYKFRYTSHKKDGNTDIYSFSGMCNVSNTAFYGTMVCRTDGNSYLAEAQIDITNGTSSGHKFVTETYSDVEFCRIIPCFNDTDTAIATVYGSASKTYGQVLNELYPYLYEHRDQLSNKTYIKLCGETDTNFYSLSWFDKTGNEAYLFHFKFNYMTSSAISFDHYDIKPSASSYYHSDITANSNNFSQFTNNKTTGYSFMLYL